MVRVIIKGGVWKNTEDEILKAAISKYGKNQWARISSLLVRKTPKQCKARWYEWLDPSIKKTEWSRQEDQKLLHLAKLMPTQWRTIAPLVGRTANQCLERYQRLLDDAEALDGERARSSLGVTGTGDAVPSADEVRRLRPGEIDPDPETKPARPDPIDMDEDEKEMLSEARARLANTQGKKAKRKARQRALDEARRLAMLQKRRELKAAGITLKHKPNKGAIDYNADIPYQKKPLPGFYDTSAEASKSYKAPIGKTLHQLDSRANPRDDATNTKRHTQAEETPNQAKQAMLARNQHHIRQLKQADQITKRRKLNLPAAQVHQDELDAIVKIAQAGERARCLVQHGLSDATDALVGSYSTLDAAYTARTRSVVAHHDTVQREPTNLKLMCCAPSVGNGDGTTTPHKTPVRDNLALNVEDHPTGSSYSTRMHAKRARKLTQSHVRQSLCSLPTPKNDFDIVVDDDDDDDDDDDVENQHEPRSNTHDEACGIREEDAAERDARMVREAAEEEARVKARCSEVVRRNLPRPTSVDVGRLNEQIEVEYRDRVQILIAREMVKLIHHDANMHPIPGAKPRDAEAIQIDTLSDTWLAAARELMRAELAQQLGFADANHETLRGLVMASLQEHDDDGLHKLECALQHKWMHRRNDQSSLIQDLHMARTKLCNAANQTSKAENSVTKLLRGYMCRNQTLYNSLNQQFNRLDNATISHTTFERLHKEETRAETERLSSLQTEIHRLKTDQSLALTAYTRLEEHRRALHDECDTLEMELNLRRLEVMNDVALF